MKMDRLFRILAVILLAVVLPLSSVAAQDFAKQDTAAHAMVVAAHPRAAQVGIRILKHGGNAVDAAVATAFMIGVVEPHASGLGGGGGMLIYLNKDHSFRYLDYYMQTSLHPDTAYSNKKDVYTPRSICIPGTPSGLIRANKLFGRLPLKTVIAPAIEIARKGFVVSQKFYTNILDKLDVISNNPGTKKLIFKDDFPVNVGDTLKNPQLAQALQNLAEKGENYFYRGAFARKAAAEIQADGGYLTEEDFAHYQTKIKKPVKINYRDYQIYSAPPAQSGTTLLEILNIYENAPLEKLKPFTKSATSIHILCEAIKRADADRFYFLGDPDAFSLPVDGMLSEGYARNRYADMDMERIKYTNNRNVPAGDPWAFHKPVPKASRQALPTDGPHTTHISVIDDEGNAVSLTQTLGHFFGSGFSSQGVIFNSAMSVFYKKPSPNRIGPARRPMTTISPTIVIKDGQIATVIGTPGGGRIFNVLAEMIIRLLDFHIPPVQAMNAPRFSIRNYSRKLSMEKRFSEKIMQALQSKGYQIKPYADFTAYFGGVQLIFYDPVLKQYIGVSDPRRDGSALGF